MIRLQVLGGIELVRDGTEVRSVLVQPKRLALLIYLRLAAPAFVARDRLIGLFWPESDDERARNALRQSLHFLRRSLGDQVVEGRGDRELGVDPAQLACDAAAFSQAMDEDRFEEALQFYTGDFLPGFFWMTRRKSNAGSKASGTITGPRPRGPPGQCANGRRRVAHWIWRCCGRAAASPSTRRVRRVSAGSWGCWQRRVTAPGRWKPTTSSNTGSPTSSTFGRHPRPGDWPSSCELTRCPRHHGHRRQCRFHPPCRSGHRRQTRARGRTLRGGCCRRQRGPSACRSGRQPWPRRLSSRWYWALPGLREVAHTAS